MSHLVFGAGLIGCYLGASILSTGQNVRFVARPRIQQRLAQGVTLSDYRGNKATLKDLRFVTTPESEAVDYLWLTVKCTGVAQTVAELEQWVGKNTVILCCQNGLGSEQSVREAFPQQKVLRVMVPFNVVETGESGLHCGSEGDLIIEHDDYVSKMVDSIQSPLLHVTTSTIMQEVLWAKLQLNLSNPVNALADIPVKSMLEDKGYRRIIAKVMLELLAVTKKQQMILPKVTAVPAQVIPYVLMLPNWLFKLLARKMLEIDPNVRTSMWWDLQAKRLTEIDHLNGAVVSQAQALGIPTPVNNSLVALIKRAQIGELQKGLSSRQLSKELGLL